MGLPITSGCDTARDRTWICSDASSTVMQCLRPLRHSGLNTSGQLTHFAGFFFVCQRVNRLGKNQISMKVVLEIVKNNKPPFGFNCHSLLYGKNMQGFSYTASQTVC